MKQPLDAEFTSFVKRHVRECRAVRVEHRDSLLPGLTLRLSCRCGVTAEWWISDQFSSAPPMSGDLDRLSA